jgi:hypothetical protein
LTVIFKAHLSAGVVKYFAGPAIEKIAVQIQKAQDRDPSTGLDLSELNLADPSGFFKKKA